MKWIKRKLRNWIFEEGPEQNFAMSTRSREIDEIDSRGLNFRVFRDSGGTVIETTVYDEKRDRHSRSLHVIVEGEDLGEKLGKIITYESLKV